MVLAFLLQEEIEGLSNKDIFGYCAVEGEERITSKEILKSPNKKE